MPPLRASNLTILSSENFACRTCEYWRLVSAPRLALQYVVEKDKQREKRKIFLKKYSVFTLKDIFRGKKSMDKG
jgi:hypothetical protein